MNWRKRDIPSKYLKLYEQSRAGKVKSAIPQTPPARQGGRIVRLFWQITLRIVRLSNSRTTWQVWQW